ncbi:MAG TPA: TIGR04053 family radical SAM/SPASM domain-containing protein [Candidatus Sulfotelmatobacter sp.]|nr:TIGR04053 family radical SAM/SPASM domain-containing protein [Candidatus Sulfotelmatobacter sp.]
MKSNFDLNQTPLVVIWEVTRACDLACFHCRASAQPQRNSLELSTMEGKKLLDDIAQLNPPIFIFTGGDPLKRPDIYELVKYAADKGLHPAMTPSATPLLNGHSLLHLKQAGLHRLALSLDGPTPALHDCFRGVAGSFARTLDAMYWANSIGLPVQINTTISRRNIAELENVLSVIRNFRIVMWSLFFMVPTGRAEAADLLSAEEVENAFARIYRIAQAVPFKVKTTEAQHYRRYLLQQRRRKDRGESLGNGVPGILPINEGKGFMFISHTGEVQPSGFLPVSVGNVRHASVSDIYRNSELFQQLRNINNLRGKCGDCEFREICGGSRARAYALSGDAFAEDPSCAYVPKARKAKPSELKCGNDRQCPHQIREDEPATSCG